MSGFEVETGWSQGKGRLLWVAGLIETRIEMSTLVFGVEIGGRELGAGEEWLVLWRRCGMRVEWGRVESRLVDGEGGTSCDTLGISDRSSSLHRGGFQGA